eukprot:6209511-Pleurochrysis_carterae.AAC.6
MQLITRQGGDRATLNEGGGNQQNRRTTRAGSATGATVCVERKGLHTFRCGGLLRCVADEGKNALATVLGVCNAHMNNQMRRVLVLCEGESKNAFEFFPAAWTAWARVPKQGSVDGDFDVDDDEPVKVATGVYVASMLQVWLALLCVIGSSTT